MAARVRYLTVCFTCFVKWFWVNCCDPGVRLGTPGVLSSTWKGEGTCSAAHSHAGVNAVTDGAAMRRIP